MVRRASLISLFLATSISVTLACGTERWAVKIGSDRDAGEINLAPEETTIAELSDLHAPPKPNTRVASRFQPAEFKTFKISGILVGIKKESDDDYHIVIQTPDDEEGTMVVESVSPGCTNGSIFTQEIEDVRTTIDEKVRVTKKMKKLNLPVTVTGVGFFDPIHGQTGVAPNGVELHPILEITFD